jgi:hypothetical protein
MRTVLGATLLSFLGAAGGQPATLSLVVSGSDDRGHSLNQTTTVAVTP